jgi:molecular chaperone HscB
MSNHDHFARLDLPRQFALDAPELERQYLARSRAVHPDYHAAGPSADLSASLELSAALNEAYNTLRDPFSRAEYLLSLYGGPTAQQEKTPDPAFLAEMMEYQERIEAVATAGEGDAFAIRGELHERENDYESWIAGEFDRFENLPAGHPDGPRHLLNIRRSLNALKTIRSLLRNLPAD